MDENNMINEVETIVVDNESIGRKIINGMIEELGLVTVIKGCLIGICVGSLSMALYFEKCDKEMK